MSELRELAEYVYNLSWDMVPSQVKAAVRHAVLDSVCAGIGAAQEEQVRRLVRSKVYFTPEGSCEIWGQGRKTDLFNAIFLNAAQGHTLELDDVHTTSKTHIGAVVLPAVWGVARKEGLSGCELALAALCGYEVTARIGKSFQVTEHRNLGWHATSTAGIFGSAAACAKLLHCSAEEILNAMGLAGQIAGGTWAFLPDGASSKVMNPAFASVNGARCAYLAKAGVTGPEHVLTSSDGGLFAVMSQHPEPAQVSADLGFVWEILHLDNKPYPACRSTHCAIDGALRLRGKCSLSPDLADEVQALPLSGECSLSLDLIDEVKVYTYEIGYKQCGEKMTSLHPQKPVHAKFSTPYTVACALLYGRVSMEDFLPEAIRRPEVLELSQKVHVYPDEAFSSRYPAHWGCRVELILTDGRKYTEEVPDASGSEYAPLTEEAILAKAESLMTPVLGAKASKDAIQVLLHIDEAERIPVL